MLYLQVYLCEGNQSCCTCNFSFALFSEELAKYVWKQKALLEKACFSDFDLLCNSLLNSMLVSSSAGAGRWRIALESESVLTGQFLPLCSHCYAILQSSLEGWIGLENPCGSMWRKAETRTMTESKKWCAVCTSPNSTSVSTVGTLHLSSHSDKVNLLPVAGLWWMLMTFVETHDS